MVESRLSKLLSLVQKQLQKYNIRDKFQILVWHSRYWQNSFQYALSVVHYKASARYIGSQFKAQIKNEEELLQCTHKASIYHLLISVFFSRSLLHATLLKNTTEECYATCPTLLQKRKYRIICSSTATADVDKSKFHLLSCCFQQRGSQK